MGDVDSGWVQLGVGGLAALVAAEVVLVVEAAVLMGPATPLISPGLFLSISHRSGQSERGLNQKKDTFNSLQIS